MPYKLRHILLALLAFASIALILWATSRYGAGLSPDSVTYIGAARQIAAGKGAIAWDGWPLIVFPPLYPALLAAVARLMGIDPLASAPVVQALLFGLIVYLSGWLFDHHLGNDLPVLALLATVVTLAATALVRVSLMAWSEPLFILLTLLYLVYTALFIERRRVMALLLMALSAALAGLARYIGIVLIPAGLATILLLRRGGWGERVRDALLFAVLAGLAPAAWLARNHALSGTWFGDRSSSSIFSLAQNLAFTYDIIRAWYVGGGGQIFLIAFLFLVGLGFLVGLVARQDQEQAVRALERLAPVLIYLVAYLAFLLYSATTTALDQIDDRLLSPIFVPLLLFVLILAAEAWRSLPARGGSRRAVYALLVALVVLSLVHPARQTASLADHVWREGEQYGSRWWREDKTLAYLATHQELARECVIYCNDPYAAYIRAGVRTRISPLRTGYNSADPANTIESVRGVWPAEGNACLVWLERSGQDYLFGLQDLQAISEMQPIARLEDGGVYAVTSAGEPPLSQ